VYDIEPMTGREFVRRVRRLARKRGLSARLDPSAGKGDHATLYLDGRRTIVPDMTGDLRPGTFRAMCRNLGISPRDL
jgi:mRNA interferase HicA